MSALVTGPLDACFRRMPSALAPCGSRDRFERLVAGVPDRLLWALGFEVRLSADGNRVDHFLGYHHRRAPMLVETADALAGESPGPDGSVWRDLHRFARRWREETQAGRDVDHVWLEFDAEPVGTEAPGVFLERNASAEELDDPGAWSDRCFDLVRELSGFDLASPIKEQFLRCLDVRPSSTRPSSLGFFLGRPNPGVRLCISGFGPRSVASFLDRVGWTGDTRQVTEVLSAVEGLPGEARPQLGMLHLDVAESIGRRIGMELVFDFVRQIRQARVVGPQLGWLRESGLCTGPKADALETWPGPHFARSSPRTPRRLYLRRVNHVKLEFDASGSLGAKAYFGARMNLPRYMQVPDGDHAVPGLADHLRGRSDPEKTPAARAGPGSRP